MSILKGLFTDFSGPSALDLLTQFRKKFVTLAERRTAELRAEIDTYESIGPSAELRGVYDEYESLRYFEQELNRLITAFMNEAREPLIALLCRIEPWNTSTVTRPPLLAERIPSFDETIPGKPTGNECGPRSAAGKDESNGT